MISIVWIVIYLFARFFMSVDEAFSFNESEFIFLIQLE
jgi:hypothetical protein